ncbi:MAG: IclR family transcriptional regulator [Stackebrandtia sp.]
MATPRPLATVERAIRILDVLATTQSDLGNNEIARRADVNVSTASRMLTTLVESELVRRVPETGRYRLGPRLVELGNAALAGIDLRETTRRHLVALTETTGETATLSVPGEHALITIDFEQSPSSVRSVAEMGRHAVLHATSIGKVYLAYGGELPPGRLAACTDKTITDRKTLAAELERVRERGWAESVGEREDEMNAVGVPVLDADGTLTGVLGLQGPATRFGARARRSAVDLLCRHAERIAAGNPAPPPD